MAAVAGLRGTGNFGTDERPKDFREMILWRRPNGSAPLTALLSKARKSGVSDPEFSWWDEPVDIVRLQVNKSGDYGTTETILAVDSSDPSDSAPANTWGTAKHLVPGDVLQVESDQASYSNEILRVVEVISDTQIKVQRGAAGSTAAAIADNAFLLKIGSAYGEGTSAPNSTSRNPIKYNNYCQIFKTSYSVTKTASVTKIRTGDVLKNEKMRRMKDHSIALEQALMWGKKHETTDDNGEPLRYTGGLRSFIPSETTTVFSAALTTTNFLNAAYKVFDYESDAGDERVAFCGNLALNVLNIMAQTDSNTEMQFGDTISVYGMNLRELILPQGRLFLKTHPLMNRNALYSKSMFIVDPTSLRWRHTSGRDTKFEDNIQAKDEDSIRGQWLTEGGLEVSLGGLTNGYLGNLSNS